MGWKKEATLRALVRDTAQRLVPAPWESTGQYALLHTLSCMEIDDVELTLADGRKLLGVATAEKSELATLLVSTERRVAQLAEELEVLGLLLRIGPKKAGG